MEVIAEAIAEAIMGVIGIICVTGLIAWVSYLVMRDE